MTGGTIRKPALAHPSTLAFQSDTGWIAAELDRLELLVPEVEGGRRRDPLAYALAYVERYGDDVLQLEHEQAFLSAATLQAWQRGEYGTAPRLVAGLAPILSRLDDTAGAVRILRLGIDASRRTQDRRQLACFTNRLGGMLNAQGQYRQARRLWLAGLELGRAFGSGVGIWKPLASFVHIVDILGDAAAAERYAEAVLGFGPDDDMDGKAVAFFIRGIYARIKQDLDTAYEDFSRSLRLLSSTPAPLSHDRQLFTAVVQTEWSRLQDTYARSQAYAASALSLAQLFNDQYTLATLLIDQGQFTRRYGPPEDVQATYARLREVSYGARTGHIHSFVRFLKRYLAATAPENQATLVRDGLLSEREAELLLLVAAGLSNRQIAEQLVITPGTVKKHLEHIYAKLNVHSRTAAVARARPFEALP